MRFQIKQVVKTLISDRILDADGLSLSDDQTRNPRPG